jgi:hypothetical protein
MSKNDLKSNKRQKMQNNKLVIRIHMLMNTFMAWRTIVLKVLKNAKCINF